ncbi:MAG: hypothetical protein ACK449_14735 [Planctomycetota bacterium]|jgi:hypothetical protein
MTKRQKQTTSKQDFPTLESILIFYPEISGVHPANEDLPRMKVWEQEILNQDIAKNGLMDEILLTIDDQLIDGRHRLIACFLGNVEVRFKKTKTDPWIVSWSKNIARGHLSVDQLSMILAQRNLKERKAAEAKAR